MTSKLVVYSRQYCHLCQNMLAELAALRGELGAAAFEVEAVDIDADPALVERYDELVPVLAAEDGRELCRYFLDAAKVREYLAALG